ncbi:MAG: chromate transporter, partial [Propioniciclava sp.]
MDAPGPAGTSDPAPRPGSGWEVFWVFLRLGLTSFGGPVAHLGYFRTELVERRRWLPDGEYADLVALCQFLPGPASSQVGFLLGLRRAGLRGALAAWAGFTAPSAAIMVAVTAGVSWVSGPLGAGVLTGLKVVAVAVVAQAV